MPGAINIAIIEDEKVQAELLKRYVENWACKKDIPAVTETFYSAESFEFCWSMDKKYNIILLDIQMKGQNGIDLAKRIRQKDDILNIIFVTAVADYIGEGYDVSAINYLIKPINEKKLYKSLDRTMLKIPEEEKAVLVDMEDGTQRIIQDDIVYIEAFAHYIDIYTMNQKFSARKSIGAIEKELDKDMFIRCHRSYIVGLKYIKRMESSELELDNGNVIPISRRQYSNTNMAFIRYFRGDTDE